MAHPPLPNPLTTEDTYLSDMAHTMRHVQDTLTDIAATLDRIATYMLDTGTTPTDLAEPAGTFDPSDHTVAEVNAYLADADPAERDRVLAAEKAGKDRTTVGT